MARPSAPRVELSLHVPTRTILKLLVTALLVWAFLRIWPEVVFLSISLLLAVALEPAVDWLDRRGIGRGPSVALLATLLLLLIAAFVLYVLPPLASQAGDLVSNLPAFHERLSRRIPRHDAVLKTVVDQIFSLPSSPEVLEQLKKPLLWGRTALSGLMTTFFVLVVTLYLLLDGKRLYAWLLAYVPRSHREKMADTIPEVSAVVTAYVRGQVITSVLFAAFVAILLAVLHVPAVAPLAILAAICDVIPVVGIIVATVPAVFLAVTISPFAALVVTGAYVLYHLFETYFIVPRVYGSSLRLSTLAVLLALIVGGAAAGILGAVLVLPLVAAYPIIERIWLKDYLGREVVADHEALAQAAESGDEAAVETVLQGEKHPGEPGAL